MLQIYLSKWLTKNKSKHIENKAKIKEIDKSEITRFQIKDKKVLSNLSILILALI